MKVQSYLSAIVLATALCGGTALVAQNPFGFGAKSGESRQSRPGETLQGSNLSRLVLSFEMKDDDAVTERIEAIETRLQNLETTISAKTSEAAASRDVAAELASAARDLKQVSGLLETPEETALGKSIRSLKAEVDSMRQNFQAKAKGRDPQLVDAYQEFIQELLAQQTRIEQMEKRLSDLGELAGQIAGSAERLIELYEDTKRFKGEAVARETLLRQIKEKTE